MRRSVTIIELVMATVILAVGLAPMISAVAETARHSAAPAQAGAAAFLAIERMEQMVAARYAPAGGYAAVVSASFPNEPSVSGLTQFARSVTITEVASDLTTPQPGSGLKKAVVTVTWNGGTRQISLDRLFADF